MNTGIKVNLRTLLPRDICQFSNSTTKKENNNATIALWDLYALQAF